MRIQVFILLLLVATCLSAQENKSIAEGNLYYHKKDFITAEKLYSDILKKTPDLPIALFNLANTYYRKNDIDKAIVHFEKVERSNASPGVKAKALYNKAVLLGQQQKLDESIIAYKNSLLLDPNDDQARENLQRALYEKQRQQQNSPKPQRKKDKLNQNQVRQLLNALQEQENQLRQRLNKSKVPAPNKPEKDW